MPLSFSEARILHLQSLIQVRVVHVFNTQEKRIINLPYFEPHAIQMKPERGEVLKWSVKGHERNWLLSHLRWHRTT
jgi:hypothetical protein